MVATLQTKLNAYKDQADRPSFKYNVSSLKDRVKADMFKVELRNKFTALNNLAEETVEDHWHELSNIWISTCKEIFNSIQFNSIQFIHTYSHNVNLQEWKRKVKRTKEK